ncbi:hypothetical protein D9615_009402 [Tricholomella constricta]|uniref:Uncharacterized protein n=1 Tax=Tricholomella constricta TaxID=117010 RepID=A0A8H5H2W8_9AGAR|nr:hypothetical protein D9615_009402 [Tricholomella constricta]
MRSLGNLCRTYSEHSEPALQLALSSSSYISNSALIPALVVSKAVGYASTAEPRYFFDDLKDVAAKQYIQKVTSIGSWVIYNQPNGIEIT